MDRAASISAKRHSEEIVVTSSVNHVSFGKAIPIGTTVTIEAKVSRAFTTSMEVFIDVWIDDDKGEKIKANEAIYTFVAVDKNGRPTKIDKILPLMVKRSKLVNKALDLKSKSNEIVDRRRIKQILKKIESKSKKMKANPRLIKTIWMNMIQNFIEHERKEFKKRK